MSRIFLITFIPHGIVDCRPCMMGILFKEKDINEIKLSLRSKGDLDVASFARKYGGGGHKNAAGCSFAGLLEDVMESVINNAREYVL